MGSIFTSFVVVVFAFSSLVGTAGDRVSSTPPPAKPVSEDGNVPAQFAAFDHDLSLRDAITLAKSLDGTVHSYRYDNGSVYGEYVITAELPPDDFLIGFADRYSSAPEVVGIVLTPRPDRKKSMQAESRVIVTGRETDFNAAPLNWDQPPISAGEAPTAIENSGKFGAELRRAGEDTDWKPEFVKVEMTRTGGTILVEQQVDWGSVNTPQGTPAGFGAEFEVDLYADRDLGDEYPSCDEDYEAEFVGDVRYATWEVGSIGTPSMAVTEPYWDSPSLDACDKQTITVGFRHPELISDYNPGQFLLSVGVWLDTTAEVEDRAEALIQLVNGLGCDLEEILIYPIPPVLGLCMGTVGSSPDEDAENPRRVLSQERYWYGPDLCFVSAGYGDVPPNDDTQCGIERNPDAVPVDEVSEMAGSPEDGWEVELTHHAESLLFQYPYTESFPALEGDPADTIDLGHLVDVHLWIGSHEAASLVAVDAAGFEPWHLDINEYYKTITLTNDALKFADNSADTMESFLTNGEISFRTGLNAPVNWMSISNQVEWWIRSLSIQRGL